MLADSSEQVMQKSEGEASEAFLRRGSSTLESRRICKG